MTSQLWQEWTGQWPLPGVAVALVGVFLALRVALPVAERGRVRAGILFCGAYLSLLFAIGAPGRAGRRRPAPSRLAAGAVVPAVLVRVGDRVGAGDLRPGAGAARGAAHHARPDPRRGLPGDGGAGAHAVAGRRHQGVHGVGAHDRGHRPRAAGDAGQRHGRPGAAAGARLRHRRLDQDRRQDHRPHPRGALARHHAGDQERRPHHRAQRPGRARRAHQLQPARHRAPAVDLHPRALPPSAGAGARAGRRRDPHGARRAQRSRARLPALGVQGRRGRLRLPLLDRRLQARRPLGQRGAQHHLVRAPPRRHGDPVPVAEREHDRDERGPHGAQARRGLRPPRRCAGPGRRLPRARRREDRSPGAPAAHGDLRPRRGDPAPGRSRRLAVPGALGARRRRAGHARRRPARDRDAVGGAVLRRDVADDRRVAQRHGGREVRRRLLRRREGSVPADPRGEARAGRHHQRDPDPPSGHARGHELHARSA